MLGDVVLVNGAPWPELPVAARRYRFRLVNASNARRYTLALDPPVAPLIQIGSDGGLLSAPVEHTELPISPAERYDVVVDFARAPMGSTVLLRNTADSGPASKVMQFRVIAPAADDSHVPARLADIPQLDPAGGPDASSISGGRTESGRSTATRSTRLAPTPRRGLGRPRRGR